MKFEEALKCMREGDHVRRVAWGNLQLIIALEGIDFRFKDDSNNIWYPETSAILATDWEVVPKPPMTFGEALQALSEGEKIRRSGWHPGEHVCFGSMITEAILRNAESLGDRAYGIEAEEITATDWEILK